MDPKSPATHSELVRARRTIGYRLILTSLFTPTVLVAVTAVAIIAIVAATALGNMRVDSRRTIKGHLNSNLESIIQLIEYWENQSTQMVEMLANDPVGHPRLLALLEKNSSDPQDLNSIDEWLHPRLVTLGYDGYVVVSLDGILLAATSRNFLGLKAQHPAALEALERAGRLGRSMSRPLPVEKILSDTLNQQSPSGTLVQYGCALIRNANHQKRGFLCLRSNPRNTLFAILETGRSGNTGEAYAIDGDGALISPSRFSTTGAILRQDVTTNELNWPTKIVEGETIGPRGASYYTQENARSLNNKNRAPSLTKVAERVLKTRDMTVYADDYSDYVGAPSSAWRAGCRTWAWRSSSNRIRRRRTPPISAR